MDYDSDYDPFIEEEIEYQESKKRKEEKVYDETPSKKQRVNETEHQEPTKKRKVIEEDEPNPKKRKESNDQEEEPVIDTHEFRIIVGSMGSGKTSLLKRYIRNRAPKIRALNIISGSGKRKYKTNYGWVNSRFVSDRFPTEETLQKLIKSATACANEYPDSIFPMIFDDMAGLSKWDSAAGKLVLTTSRQANMPIFLLVHQFTDGINTLCRTLATQVCIFQQNEPHAIESLFKNFGKSSTNLCNKEEFESKVRSLEKYHYLEYDKSTRLFEEKISIEIPNYRIYILPEDEKAAQRDDVELVYGNRFMNKRTNKMTSFNATVWQIGKPEEDEKEVVLDEIDFLTGDVNDKKEIEKVEEDNTEIKSLDKSKFLSFLKEEETPLTIPELVTKHRLRGLMIYLSSEPEERDMMQKFFPDFNKLDFVNMKLKDLKCWYGNYKILSGVGENIASASNSIDVVGQGIETVLNTFTYGNVNRKPIADALGRLKKKKIHETIRKSEPLEDKDLSMEDYIWELGVPLLSVYNDFQGIKRAELALLNG